VKHDRHRPPVPPRRPGPAPAPPPPTTDDDGAAIPADAAAEEHLGSDAGNAGGSDDATAADHDPAEPTPLARLVASLPDGAAFQAALAKPFRRALRRHPHRGTLHGWGTLEAIPWTNPRAPATPANATDPQSAARPPAEGAARPSAQDAQGYFHDADVDPGDRLDYHTGAAYPQDAASQLPVILLDPQPGETVIDACAAPGSKTTQIGLALGDHGLLLALDAAPARRRVLVENLARQGIASALVLPLSLASLAARHPRAADAVLVDAPCSGHRDVRARQSRRLGERQGALLAHAAALVRPGGRLVYSTCTPWPDEDETVIAAFLAAHPGWIVDTPMPLGCDRDLAGLGALRLWPHRQGCEPFFACRLRAPGDADRDAQGAAGTLAHAGHLPDHHHALAAILPGTDLHCWERGGVLFAATHAAAACALPAEARGVRLGRLRDTRSGPRLDLEPWAAQALIARGARAVTVPRATACDLWAGGTDPGLHPGDLVRTADGAPLAAAGKDGRLDLPSRLRRAGLR
jgi:16S rRNA C967 or C1407 C5-methylase (RsmB/RsmF family)